MPFPRPGVPGRDATSKNTTDNQGFFASVVQPDVTGEKVGHFCCWPVPRLRESDRRDCCCFVIATAALRTSTGTGKVRIYFRRKGQRNIVLTETPGTRSSRPTISASFAANWDCRPRSATLPRGWIHYVG